MSRSTYFFQDCPTCGRILRVRVEYLGKKLVCQHCQADFDACDPTSGSFPPSDSGLALVRRADELLATPGFRRVHPR